MLPIQNSPEYKTYTRNGEDIKIQEILSTVERGVYIDVGASTPIEDSNTYALYERGWMGICIEPQPEHAIEHRRVRPRDIFIPALAGAGFGIETLWHMHAQQLATASKEFQTWWATPPSPGNPKSYCAPERQSQTQVPVVTLNAVIEKYQLSTIHLLSLDVEGYEENVLRGLDLGRHRPWLIVAEAVFPHSTIPADENWRHLILDAGYTEVARDDYNRFYAASERIPV